MKAHIAFEGLARQNRLRTRLRWHVVNRKIDEWVKLSLPKKIYILQSGFEQTAIIQGKLVSDNLHRRAALVREPKATNKLVASRIRKVGGMLMKGIATQDKVLCLDRDQGL